MSNFYDVKHQIVMRVEADTEEEAKKTVEEFYEEGVVIDWIEISKWEEFLEANFCKANPLTGNRPCDTKAGCCDACNTEEAQDLYKSFKNREYMRIVKQKAYDLHMFVENEYRNSIRMEDRDTSFIMEALQEADEKVLNKLAKRVGFIPSFNWKENSGDRYNLMCKIEEKCQV